MMATRKKHPELTDRNRQLLKLLVSQYIEDGQPVGSKTLAQSSGLDLSAATIRNIMSDLEALGLVHSPHTSAGRVPTEEGYRLFIDSLLTVQPLEAENIANFQTEMNMADSTTGLVSHASEFLSGITHLAGIVTVPYKLASLKMLEFLPLSENRVLAIIVTSDLEVENRIIHVHRKYSQDELQHIANYLNEHFAGQDINSIYHRLLGEMKTAREHMDRMMQSAVDMAEQVFAADHDEELLVAGQTNLMDIDDLANVNKLKELFEIFNEKREILHLMDRTMKADGIQIYIGQESGYGVFDDCSVVASTYQVNGQTAGVLGVIGPTRMAYERVIPAVDITARILGAALNSRK